MDGSASASLQRLFEHDFYTGDEHGSPFVWTVLQIVEGTNCDLVLSGLHFLFVQDHPVVPDNARTAIVTISLDFSRKILANELAVDGTDHLTDFFVRS